jgi:CheY-like chemotaxis protein
MSDPTYRTTEAGRAAWENQDSAVPADYRLILWLIDFHGHDYIHNLVKRFPAHLLPEWLGEMEQLGLVERGDARTLVQSEVDRTAAFSQRHLARLTRVIAAAGNQLSQLGAYVAEHRLAGRPPAKKDAGEVVILIVEDDPDQLALADLRVTMAGYSVRIANSLEAMQKNLAEQGRPDLVLLDIMLPGRSGFEVCREIRAGPRAKATRVLMLTAKGGAGDEARGMDAGADDYMTKPFSTHDLVARVRALLGEPAR